MLKVSERRAAEARQYVVSAIEELGEGFLSQWLEVHVTTVRRWADGTTKVPRAAVVAIEAHRGRLPGMATRVWERWTINRNDGLLYGPEGRGHSAGSILAQQYERALIAALQNQVRDLKARLTQALDDGNEAANDPLVQRL